MPLLSIRRTRAAVGTGLPARVPFPAPSLLDVAAGLSSRQRNMRRHELRHFQSQPLNTPSDPCSLPMTRLLTRRPRAKITATASVGP